MNDMNRWLRPGSSVLAAIICAVAYPCAHAGTIDWNQWTSATTGTIAPDGVSVTFSIAGQGSTDSRVTSYPSYTPSTTFADGTIVANAPTATDGIIQLTGGNNNVNTVTFSTAIVDPVMAIWSLGAQGTPATFDFTNATPTFVAGGPSAEFGGSSITISGDTVSGAEGNGTVQFLGTFTSLSWTNPTYEGWYGFDVGIAGTAGPPAVPEPATSGLLALGLAGIGLVRRRRRSR